MDTSTEMNKTERNKFFVLFFLGVSYSTLLFFTLFYFGMIPQWKSMTPVWVMGLMWGFFSFVSYLLLTMTYGLHKEDPECVFPKYLDMALAWLLVHSPLPVRALFMLAYPPIAITVVVLFAGKAECDAGEERIRKEVRRDLGIQ